MFSIICNLSIHQLKNMGKAKNAAITVNMIDFGGAVTLLVLGILASSGHGDALINSLNTIQGVDCGGILMIVGAILTFVVAGKTSQNSTHKIKSSLQGSLSSEEDPIF